MIKAFKRIFLKFGRAIQYSRSGFYRMHFMEWLRYQSRVDYVLTAARASLQSDAMRYCAAHPVMLLARSARCATVPLDPSCEELTSSIQNKSKLKFEASRDIIQPIRVPRNLQGYKTGSRLEFNRSVEMFKRFVIIYDILQ